MPEHNSESALQYLIEHYSYISNVAELVRDYPSFDKKYRNLLTKSNLTMKECDNFLTEFFQQVLIDYCISIIQEIKDLEGTQFAYSSHRQKIQDYLAILRNEKLTLTELYHADELIKREDEKLYEKSQIENYNRRKFWISFISSLALSFLLGIASGYLLWLLGYS